MKRFLALLLVLVMILSVVACNKPAEAPKEEPKEEQTAEAPAEETKEAESQEAPADGEKVLNLLQSSDIPSLVSWLATDEVSFTILGNINSGLFYMNNDKVTEGDMAESYEVSEDNLKYTFKLRDAEWVTVDGESYAPVTAHDFVYAWKKMADPAEASQYSFLLRTAGIKNADKTITLSETLVGLKGAQNDLAVMKPGDFEEKDGKTAEQQFEEKKAALEEQIAATEAELSEEYGSVEEAEAAVKTEIDNLGITAVDEKTLVVELEVPVPFFMDLMIFPSFWPANQKFVEEKGDKYGTTNADFLYNGAFILKEWSLSQRVLLTKNDKYWDAANTTIDKVDQQVILGIDNNTAVNMYLDDKIDRVGLSGENVELHGNRPDASPLEDTVQFYIEVNQGNGPDNKNRALLSDVRFRKAMNMVFDKKYITDTIFKNGSLPSDYFMPRNFVSDKNGKDFREVAEDLYGGGEGYNKYNPEEAKKLWEEVKADLGLTEVELSFMNFAGDAAANTATHIKDEFENTFDGLTLNIEVLPFSEKIRRASAGEYDLNFAGWGPDYADAMTFMDLWVKGGGHNTLGYDNPEYDAIITNAKTGELTAPDKAEERFKELVRAEKILLEDDQALIPLYQRSGIVLTDPKIKEYVVHGIGPSVQFKNVVME